MNKPNDPDKARGLYDKFEVRRTDADAAARHVGCRYFVLDLTHDEFAPVAIAAYATEARANGYAALADDLERELPDEPELERNQP